MAISRANIAACILSALTLASDCVGQDAALGAGGLWTNIQWRIDSAYSRWAKMENGLLVVDVPKDCSNVCAYAKAKIDLRSVDRAALEIEVQARSFGVDSVAGPGRGMKVALHYVDGLTGRKKYIYNRNIGAKAFDWRKVGLFVPFGEVPPLSSPSPEIVLGIQQASGRVEFDLRSIVVRKAVVQATKADGDRVVAYPERMTRMPLLRGVMSPGAFRTTEKDIEDLRQMGVGLVRVQMNSFIKEYEDLAAKSMSDWNAWFEKWIVHIDDILDWVEARDMRIVIDMHAPPVGSYGKRCTTFQNAEYAERFVSAWGELARRYRNRKGVYGYDLMNEPAQCEPALPGCDYWSLQRRAAEAIRAIDPDATIVVEANEWDGPPGFDYLCDFGMDNLVYQVHMYAPAGFTHQGAKDKAMPAAGSLWHYPSRDPKRPLSREDLRRTLQPVVDFQRRHRCRILVGEFSASLFAPGAAEYVADYIDLFEEYGWDWTYHAFRESLLWNVERAPELANGKFRNVDNPRYFVLTRAFRNSLRVEMPQRDIAVTEDRRLGKCEAALDVSGGGRIAFSALVSVSFSDDGPIGDAVEMTVSCFGSQGGMLCCERVAFRDYVELGHRYRAFDETLCIPRDATKAVLTFSARNRIGEARVSNVRAAELGKGQRTSILSAAENDSELGRMSGNAQWGGREPRIAVVNPVCGQDPARVISLAGEWDFTTPEREGRREMPLRNGNCTRYYSVPWKNPRKITVPSCWEAEGVGAAGTGVCWAAWWDNSMKPLRHAYQGTGWYRRTVDLPAEWKDSRIWIKLGGIKSAGYVWVNNRQVALVSNYCGTEKYEITDVVRAGQPATISIQVDNRIPSRKGLMSSSHCFGGIYRSVEIESTPKTFMDDVWVRGDFDARRAEVHVDVASCDDKSKRGRGRQKAGAYSLRVAVDGTTESVVLRSESGGSSGSVVHAALSVPLNDFRPWSPEHPNLYTAKVELVENGRVVQTRSERFGVRKIEVRGKEFYLNGHPFFVRGFGDDNVYPLTGLSPADRQFHLRHLSLARKAGFNFVRLHTHCELPEYFEAADEAGIMVQPELPYYSDEPGERFAFDPKGDVTELWRHYRRYPSFAVYSMGNEGSFGPDLDRALHKYVKAMDPDRLKLNQDNHNPASNPPECSDYQGGPKSVWPRGSVDYDRPFVAHEYMNLCVKFDVRREGRYNGLWMPPGTHRERIGWLAGLGLDAAWGDRLQDAQHLLQAIWQKRGIEAARTDPHCDGYSFWTIVDVVVWNEKAKAFSAQGLFDPLWEQKRNGLSADEFAVFNREKGIFADFADDRRVYTSGEKLAAEVLYADYGEKPAPDGALTWSLESAGVDLASGSIDVGLQPGGAARRIASLGFAVPETGRPVRARLRLQLSGGEASNAYDVWIFPRRGRRDATYVAVDDSLASVLSARYSGLIPSARFLDADVVIAPFGSALAQNAIARGVRTITLDGCGGEPNVSLGWWWMGNQVGTAFIDHPALNGIPHCGALDELMFRIVKKGRPLPDACLAGAKLIAVGEGGDSCYCYLAEKGRTLMAFGLDVLSSTAEGTALLDGLVDYARRMP